MTREPRDETAVPGGPGDERRDDPIPDSEKDQADGLVCAHAESTQESANHAGLRVSRRSVHLSLYSRPPSEAALNPST